MENRDCSRTFYKNYESSHVVQPRTASVGRRHTSFSEPENAVFIHPLQVRTGLRYPTANNEDGARLDVYASGFWGGKQTSEGIFNVKVKAIAPSYRKSYCGTQVSSP